LVTFDQSSDVRGVQSVSGFLLAVYGSKSAPEVGISYAPQRCGSGFGDFLQVSVAIRP
jgi:hypothetical protein